MYIATLSFFGNDGTLEAVGYDTNARFNNVTIANNMFFKSQAEAGLKFHSPYNKNNYTGRKGKQFFTREKL